MGGVERGSDGDHKHEPGQEGCVGAKAGEVFPDRELEPAEHAQTDADHKLDGIGVDQTNHDKDEPDEDRDCPDREIAPGRRRTLVHGLFKAVRPPAESGPWLPAPGSPRQRFGFRSVLTGVLSRWSRCSAPTCLSAALPATGH